MTNGETNSPSSINLRIFTTMFATPCDPSSFTALSFFFAILRFNCLATSTSEEHHSNYGEPWAGGRDVFEFLAEASRLKPNARVLEIGCGTLRVLILISPLMLLITSFLFHLLVITSFLFQITFLYNTKDFVSDIGEVYQQ